VSGALFLNATLIHNAAPTIEQPLLCVARRSQ